MRGWCHVSCTDESKNGPPSLARMTLSRIVVKFEKLCKQHLLLSEKRRFSQGGGVLRFEVTTFLNREPLLLTMADCVIL